ncbi:hypothetical protein F5884DRAFT_807410 [Xylogone sp. PMI_703]|nr:hypothetical protein F5884DRAFT_807410 [Xylogone sp. PMI_703]
MPHVSEKPVALLKIGQSQPEKDPDWALAKQDVIDVCPLDIYTREELLTRLKPLDGEMPISSPTKSGERVLISRSLLEPELNRGIQECEAKGIQLIIIDCTGEFNLVASTAKIIFPGQVLHQKALQRVWKAGEKVAVLVPADEQQSFLTERWVSRLPKSVEVKAFTLSPNASLDEAAKTAKKLASEGYSAAIMDCFGYTVAQGKAVEEAGLVVYLAKGVVIDTLNDEH